MGSRRAFAMVAAVMLAALSALVPVPAASAQPAPEDEAQGSMMFVLDASGSMVAPLPSGGTRMDAAKGAMNTLIDALPVNLHVGFEVYGTGTGNSPAEKAAGCQDVQVLQPVGQVDRAAMKAQVAGLNPRGYTPIGHSLEQAAAALPADGPRSIVLISDGIDTCAPPPPCDVAKSLDGAGVELAVHTVGFQVDDAARAELECIADATGGEYNDAPDGDALTDLLPEIADRAFRDYQVTGDAITGAESMADAMFMPPGQHFDSVERDTPTYYLVNVPEGSTGYFSAVHVVVQGEDRVDSGVVLRLIDSRKRVCAESKGFRDYVYDGPETASVTWTNDPERSRCGDGPKFLELTWNNKRTEAGDEVELRSVVEPPLAGAAGERSKGVERFTEPSAEPDVIWGGGSFNDAATMPGTGRYFDKLNYSEYSVYKVWLDWGQALSYEVRFPDSERVGDATVATELRGPSMSNSREEWWRSTEFDGSAAKLGPLATPKVAYANRSGGEDVKYAALAGYYYIVVKLSPVWSDGNAVPDVQPVFEIALNVTGEAAPGPSYAGNVSDPSVEPSVPAELPATTEVANRSAAAEEDGTFPWWLAGGIGGVVLVAVVVLVLLRRRAGRNRSGILPG